MLEDYMWHGTEENPEWNADDEHLGELNFSSLSAVTELHADTCGIDPLPPNLVHLHDDVEVVQHIWQLKSLKRIGGSFGLDTALTLQGAAVVPGLTHIGLSLGARNVFAAGEPGLGPSPDAGMEWQMDALVAAGIADAVREVYVSNDSSFEAFGAAFVQQLARLPNLAHLQLETAGLSPEGVVEISRLTSLTCLEVMHYTDAGGWKSQQLYGAGPPFMLQLEGLNPTRH